MTQKREAVQEGSPYDRESAENTISRVIDALTETADRLTYLARNINLDGDPLDSDQRKLIRMALYPQLEAHNRELEWGFLMNDEEMIEHSAESVRRMLAYPSMVGLG